MRSILIGIIALLFFGNAAAQRPTAKATPKPKPASARPTPEPTPAPTPTPDPAAVEAELFERAHAATVLSDRVALLEKFTVEFPASERLEEARESLMIARASFGDERIDGGDLAGGMELLKKTVTESPENTPDGLFGDVIMKIPGSLYFRGRRAEAFEIASLIEKRFESNAARLAALANFHLAVENGTDALRLANMAVELDPASSAAYQALGMAHRLNFDLELASGSFAKAVEADPASMAAKRGLADIYRALGSSDEAAVIYRQVLSANENDVQARSGLVLALFESGKRADAEAELTSALQSNARNLPLLAGVAYWYGVNGDGTKATEYARRAIELEPRYVWSHIALARGQMASGDPVAAEKTLTAARRYGNFPSLEYEIALARYKAGFFRDAAEGLSRNFTIENGEARTRLGGRIERAAKSLPELIAAERQASILAPRGADDADAAEKLLELPSLLEAAGAESTDADKLAAAAEKFAAGSDAMRIHRALFAADLLLEKKAAPEKALELARLATGNTEAGLTVPNPAAAVMAGELYAPRALAASRDEFLLVPDVPKSTLLAILRGRVEEISGWALMEQGDAEGASVRFRRALSVLPEKSAWWRSTKWRYGNALAATGKEAEALEQYLQGYDPDKPDIVKYIVVEALYRKLNNGIVGLEAKVGPSPLPKTDQPAAAPISDPAPDTSKPAEGKPADTDAAPKQETPPAAEPTQVTPATAEPARETESRIEKVSDKKSDEQPVPEPEKSPAEVKPEEKEKNTEGQKEPPTAPQKSAESLPQPETRAEPAKEPLPTPQPAAEPTPEPSPMPAAQPVAEPTPETSPVPVDVKTEEKPVGDAEKKVDPAPVPVESSEPQKTEKTDSEKPASDTGAEKPGAKPLFEPIIITVPKAQPVKKPESPADNPAAETSDGQAETAKPAEPSTQEIASGAARPRIIEGKEIVSIRPCRISASQENISLINGGGTIGILLAIEDGEIREVKAENENPDDIEVTAEPEIAGVQGRAFYIIRAKSTRTGSYRVFFTAPCGRKEITVDVR